MAVDTHFARILQIICLKDGGGYTFCENIADNLSLGQGLEHIMRNIEENVCQVCIWEQIKNRLSQKIGKEDEWSIASSPNLI